MQAEIHLGNFFEGSIAAMKSKGHNLKSQMHAAGLALRVPPSSCLLHLLTGNHSMYALLGWGLQHGETRVAS
jgi:hypothetical protein